jgi:hypothetical protein
VAGQWNDDRETVMVCWAGQRAQQAAEQLHGMGFTHVTMLEGGTKAWKAEGLPLERERAGIPLSRQVFIGAGVFILAGLGLALLNPWFLVLDVFVGVMMISAGATGFCPMAMGLAKMPWNRKLTNSDPKADVEARNCDAGSCCAA